MCEHRLKWFLLNATFGEQQFFWRYSCQWWWETVKNDKNNTIKVDCNKQVIVVMHMKWIPKQSHNFSKNVWRLMLLLPWRGDDEHGKAHRLDSSAREYPITLSRDRNTKAKESDPNHMLENLLWKYEKRSMWKMHYETEFKIWSMMHKRTTQRKI